MRIKSTKAKQDALSDDEIEQLKWACRGIRDEFVVYARTCFGYGFEYLLSLHLDGWSRNPPSKERWGILSTLHGNSMQKSICSGWKAYGKYVDAMGVVEAINNKGGRLYD